ncbi:MAG: helix-turn-helix transcriptional regulator [Dehalococcoidia bacterium]|nr:MAG: helix-turn-helix transcriptional regulator [Dehalococcoidia bacterium]
MDHAEVTSVEHSVLCMFLFGMSPEEVAARRCIAISTVHTHLKHLYAKCKVHSRAALIVWATSHLGCCAFPARERPIDSPPKR